MATKAPAFQLYSADFFMDTGEWSIEEIGIYTRLLLSEWCNGDLPTEPTRLARIAGCDPKRFKNRWLVVRTKFQVNGNGRYINLRMEEEREKQRKYRELQSQKGKISAEKRSTTVTTTVEPVLQPQGQPKGNSSIFSLLNKDLKAENPPPESSALPSKNEKELEQIKIEIDEICERLVKSKKFPDAFQFRNMLIKKMKHPKAILHTLKRIRDATHEIDPWKYGMHIIQVESQNYTERDCIAKHERRKEEELRD